MQASQTHLIMKIKNDHQLAAIKMSETFKNMIFV